MYFESFTQSSVGTKQNIDAFFTATVINFMGKTNRKKSLSKFEDIRKFNTQAREFDVIFKSAHVGGL